MSDLFEDSSLNKLCAQNLHRMYTKREKILCSLKNCSQNCDMSSLQENLHKIEYYIDLCWKCSKQSHAEDLHIISVHL